MKNTHFSLALPILLFMVSMMGIGFFSPANAEIRQNDKKISARPNRPYISPTPGRIPIMASSLCLYGTLPTQKEIADFRDCGFDALIQDNKEELYDSLFSLLEGSGIGLFASANALRGPSVEKCRDFMERYKNNPVLVGWEFRDEPKFADLGMLKDIFNVMTETDPHHLIHLNVVGEMAKDYVGPDTPDIASYLDTLQNCFAPGVWSYDVYPIKILDNNGVVIVEYDKFYSDLEIFSKMAARTGRPFWAYCQGVGFRQGRICKPVPKEEYLRFEAFSALAYGAQGIIYWTYRQCRDVPSINFQYLEGCIDINGNKTKVWNAAKKVNNEIKKYNDVFLGARLVDVVHMGTTLYKDTRRVESRSFGPLRNIRSGKAGVMMSLLNNNGRQYLVIVNHDVINKEKIAAGVAAGNSLIWISNGGKKIIQGGNLNVTLNPGGYSIFEVID